MLFSNKQKNSNITKLMREILLELPTNLKLILFPLQISKSNIMFSLNTGFL